MSKASGLIIWQSRVSTQILAENESDIKVGLHRDLPAGIISGSERNWRQGRVSDCSAHDGRCRSCGIRPSKAGPISVMGRM